MLVAAQGVALTLTDGDAGTSDAAWRVGVGHCFICLSRPLDRLGNRGSGRLEHLHPPGPPAAGREGRLRGSGTLRPLALPASSPGIPFCDAWAPVHTNLVMASNAGTGVACSLPGTF